MATITLSEKENSRKKFKVEINLNQWEKLADVFGLYNSKFLKSLGTSLKEAKTGKVSKTDPLQTFSL